MTSKTDALMSLCPGAEWVMTGDVLSWRDANQAEPTSDAIAAEVTRLQELAPWNKLRQQRNRLIADTDWEIVKHKELGTNISTALKTYRQELRDLPANTSDPANPVWPTKPGDAS